jgi:hypothetical protein
MDLSFEHKDWQKALHAGESLSGCDYTPEWHALRSRLAAALCARREYSQPDGKKTETSGSFDQPSANLLSAFQKSSHTVNLTALANGKSDGGIEAHTAGESDAGGRGNP